MTLHRPLAHQSHTQQSIAQQTIAQQPPADRPGRSRRRSSRLAGGLLVAATVSGALAATAAGSAAPASAIESVTGRANVFVEIGHSPGTTIPVVVSTRSDRAAEARVVRTGRGSYTITLDKVTGSRGNAQLFVKHRAGTVRDDLCVIRGVTAGARRTTVRVRCFDGVTGQRTDATDFALQYASRNQFDSSGTVPAHFTLTSGSATRSHSPATQFRSDQSTTKAKVIRTGQGRYRVALPTGDQAYPALDGVAFVSAVGERARYCNPQLWYPTTGPNTMNVEVACYDRNGSLADSRFSLVLTRGNQYGLQLRGGSQYVGTPWPAPGFGEVSWYGDNSSGANNITGFAFDVEGIVGTVEYPGVEPELNHDMNAYAVSAYGGNHRCFHLATQPGATPGSVKGSVLCRSAGGAVVEADFSHGYVS